MFSDPYFLLGVLGAACILVAFVLNQIQYWKHDDLMYDIVNFLGSFFLFLYAVDGQVWPFVVLNAVWASVSLRDVFSDLKQGPLQGKRKG